MCDGVLFSGWWVGGKEVRMETVFVCVGGWSIPGGHKFTLGYWYTPVKKSRAWEHFALLSA